MLTANATLIIASAAAQPTEVWVATTGDDSNPGTQDRPFRTIQKGVDSVATGGTVHVAAGAYKENINIGKSLILKAVSGRPVIDGDRTGDGKPDGSCITINANGVTIEGFEIKNGYNGITGQTSNSIIKNNIIHDHLNYIGSNGVGILLWGDNDNNQILNNEIYDNDRQGIFVGYDDFDPNPDTRPKVSSGNTISGNKIYHNGLYRQANGPDASAYGIQLWNADGNIIQKNEVYNHDDWFPDPGRPTFDFAQGIYLCASFHNTVEGNNLHNNNYGVGLWSTGATIPSPEKTRINFNNIAGNTGYGIRNFNTVPVDAEHNWWGSATGPTHASNPGGTGDKVSDNVDFTPWLGAPISNVDSRAVPAGATTTVGSKDLGVSADVTTSTGTPTVTVATYTSNPGGRPTFSALGKYVDVQIDNAAGVTQIMIKVYYTDAEVTASGITESTLKLYWWTGSAWQACSDSGVDTVNNYIWARITATSTPSLSQLVGSIFGGGGVKPAPVGGILVPVNKLAVLAPYLGLLGLVGAVAAVAVTLRRRNA